MSKAGKKRLTPKQQLFVHEYLVDMNATRSYLRAGYKASEKVARVNAAKLLTSTNISSAIHEALGRRLSKLDISNDTVLQEIAKSAFSNMLDYIKIQEDGTAYVDLSKLTREQAAAILEIAYDDAKSSAEGATRSVRRVKFKLASKLASLELLGKYLKLFSDTTPVISPEMENILKDVLSGQMTVREAAYRITMLGLPLPEALKIELSKAQPEPPPPDLPVGMSDGELEAAYQANLLKQEQETAEFLPRRRKEVQDIKDELKHQDSFKPDAKNKIRGSD